jgi:hypothetical protein
MNNSISTAQHYLEGEGLIYLPDINKAGIHVRGLAKLLKCDTDSISRLSKGVGVNEILEAEIKTVGGIQSTKFILEDGVVNLLEIIQDSARVKAETKKEAKLLYRRFARAGFKLYAMMQVAPEKLGMSPQSSPRKSLNDLSRIQLWALFLYKEVETKSFSPDIKVLDGIDPIFWGAHVDVLRYAFARKRLAELEWVQPAHDLHYEVFGDPKTLVKDMRQEFDELQDLRRYVGAGESLGMAKALEDFELAINGALAA